jgi:branched-chain amino acid transport system permease protein
MLIIFLTIAFHYFIKRTRTGILIRAITEDREAAVMIGACVKRISTITFGIGAAIAAVSGVFIILITCVTAFHGLVLTVKALTVIILGGMGSFPGAILGGMILGLSETYTAYFLGGEWANLISILVLIIVLIVKPSGMFGRRWT